MKIALELVGVDVKSHDGIYGQMGQRRIVKPGIYVCKFYGRNTTLSLEISEDSELAEHIAMFRQTAGQNAEFIFDIAGDNVDSYFSKTIADLTEEKMILFEKLSKLSELSENRLNIILDQQSHVNELAILKTKWWYKLFTHLK